MARCAGITRSGQRCQLDALAGAQWCYGHDPSRAQERHTNAVRAGRTGGRGRPGAPEIADIKAGLRAVIDGVLSGRTERSCGAVAIQGYNVLIRAVEAQRKIAEQDELLERIELLEQAQTGRGRAWG
jgi:hypothetical protein